MVTSGRMPQGVEGRGLRPSSSRPPAAGTASTAMAQAATGVEEGGHGCPGQALNGSSMAT
jgi:hypothetical protein